MKASSPPWQVSREDDPSRWNTLVSSLPYSHVLQSHLWAQVKSRHGWTAMPLFFQASEGVKAAALILQRRLPYLPWGIMYVPKGPALDYNNLSLVREVLTYLENLAKAQRAILIKIDPDVAFKDDEPEWTEGQTQDAIALPSPVSPGIRELLRERGWVFSQEQVQFKNTLLIDLSQSEEALLANMKPKTRYNIRLATRKGVTVRAGGLGDLAMFYQMYQETALRDNFLIRPFNYYRDVWQTFLENDLADLLLAEWEGTVLAGLMLFRFAHKAWYMYGASSNQGRNLMPNYLLQWEAMCLSKRKGCLVYDLWGAPDELNEADPLWGVYRFKEGFGGRLVRHIGAYDFPAHPLFFRLYSVILPRYLSWLRSRHRQGPV